MLYRPARPHTWRFLLSRYCALDFSPTSLFIFNIITQFNPLEKERLIILSLEILPALIHMGKETVKNETNMKQTRMCPLRFGRYSSSLHFLCGSSFFFSGWKKFFVPCPGRSRAKYCLLALWWWLWHPALRDVGRAVLSLSLTEEKCGLWGAGMDGRRGSETANGYFAAGM